MPRFMVSPATRFPDLAIPPELDGRLLTFEGTQHTAALHGDRCIDNAVTAYLVNDTLPADGTRCSPS